MPALAMDPFALIRADPWLLWSARAVGLLFALAAAAIIVRLLYGAARGKLDLADLVTGPSGRLSASRVAYLVGVVVSSIVVLRDATDGRVNETLVLFYLGALGLFDVTKRGINVIEKIKLNGKDRGAPEPKYQG